MQLGAALGSNQEITDGIIKEFFALCRHPHGTWNEKALIDELERKLRNIGLSPVRDEWNNLMADIPAAKGREQAPLTILQGHVDMVCVGVDGWNPAIDTVNPIVNNEVLQTDGRSSLGADNGLGNATVLYLLSRPIVHGPLRLIFTVAEESGLEGAQKIDSHWLDGARYLINTDGFTFGEAVVSSAGARREYYTRKLTTIPVTQDAAVTITLSHFAGGHSGFDIHRGRGNAIALMALLLEKLTREIPCQVAELRGGDAANAIPSHCTATVTCNEIDLPRLKQLTDAFRVQMTNAYRRADKKAIVSVTPAHLPQTVWSEECQKATIGLLSLLFTGVLAMHDDFPDKVCASGNLGTVGTENGIITIDGFLRSSDPFYEKLMARRNSTAAALTGFEVTISPYPGWPWTGKNPLADKLGAHYKLLTGRKMTVTATHVGLEPSVFLEKKTDLIAVTIGPDILDAHSTAERAPLKNLPNYARLLALLLADLPR
jgi:dipeptidase D